MKMVDSGAEGIKQSPVTFQVSPAGGETQCREGGLEPDHIGPWDDVREKGLSWSERGCGQAAAAWKRMVMMMMEPKDLAVEM